MVEDKIKYSVPNITDKYEPTPEAHAEIFRIMNRRRRYRPSDFVKQHFIPNIAENSEQAEWFRQHNDSYIRGY